MSRFLLYLKLIGLFLAALVIGLEANHSSVSAQTTSPLVINEIDYDQPETDTAEFIELKNVGSTPLVLSSYSLELVSGSSGGATIYNTIPLPGGTLPPGGYWVICGDVSNVANCNQDITPDSDLIQNGAPDAVALRLGGTLVDTVSYEGDTAAPYTEGSGFLIGDESGLPGLGISRCADGQDTDQNSRDFASSPITPGAPNDCSCGTPATRIHDVQGAGSVSPLAGSTGVVIEGVVVGDFQGPSGLDGFFVQEEDNQTDTDPATSEGIFVSDGPFGLDVQPGDVVSVTGSVGESSGLTQIHSVSSLQVCGTGVTVTPSSVTLPIPQPVSGVDFLEGFEGMLVTFPQTLVVSDHFNLHRFGELTLADQRLFAPTAVAPPGSAALIQQDLNNRSRIQLDDGSNVINPTSLPPYLGAGNTLRLGDSTAGVVGVLGVGSRIYEVHPISGISFTRNNSRDTQPPPVGGELKVASFNVLNYFTTIDGSGPICGPSADQACRGADTQAELDRQLEKLVSAITEISPDILGLVSIENNDSASLQSLVIGLNTVAGAGTFEFIDTGTIGSDAIKVGLIYQPATISPVGSYRILDSSVDSTFLDGKNRPSLVQSFQELASGETINVAVNHFKSRGSPCDDVGDPDSGDGQGNCNRTRTAAASALVGWLATDPTGSGDPDFLIIGDLNSYAQEDPINAITSAGYSDLLGSTLGTSAYTFVFDGQSGYLDYALASPGLVRQVTGVSEWHINADEPEVLDYNDFNPPGLYSADPFRSSDHDPVIVGLSLGGSPKVDSITAMDVGESHLGQSSYSFTVIYSGDSAVDVSTIDGDDVTVTGLNITLPVVDVSVSDSTNGSPRTATYTVTPPGVFWDAADNGRYTIGIVANQVFDVVGEPVPPVNDGFNVNIAANGTVIITKVTTPSGGTDFGFTNDITSPKKFRLDDFQSKTFTDVAPGRYTVTENDPGSNYQLTDITCVETGNGGSTSDLNNRKAIIELDAGETVECIFRNELQVGTIVIKKFTIPPGGTGFSFKGDIAAPKQFDLDHGQSKTFINITPGTYKVSENNPGPGFSLVGLSCNDPDDESTINVSARSVTIDLDKGETVECAFTNKNLQSGVVQLVGDRLIIVGTDGNDTVQIKDAGPSINVYVDFLEGSPFSFPQSLIGQIIANLGDGDDKLTISSKVKIPAIVHGGPGNDVVNAGGGPSVLLGDNGDDVLKGGESNDILIGGLDADRGVGKNGDDILIGGNTTHDSDDQALAAILAEWNSADDYGTRVNNIRSGASPLGGISLKRGVSVFPDGDQDVLNGSSDQDWFFADPIEDKLPGLSSKDEELVD